MRTRNLRSRHRYAPFLLFFSFFSTFLLDVLLLPIVSINWFFFFLFIFSFYSPSPQCINPESRNRKEYFFVSLSIFICTLIWLNFIKIYTSDHFLPSFRSSRSSISSLHFSLFIPTSTRVLVRSKRRLNRSNSRRRWLRVHDPHPTLLLLRDVLFLNDVLVMTRKFLSEDFIPASSIKRSLNRFREIPRFLSTFSRFFFNNNCFRFVSQYQEIRA